MRFAAALAAWLAGIASATAVISADPPHEGHVAKRSPVHSILHAVSRGCVNY
jgi:anion-transporting  ArsA/GET3 family ATPase